MRTPDEMATMAIAAVRAMKPEADAQGVGIVLLLVALDHQPSLAMGIATSIRPSEAAELAGEAAGHFLNMPDPAPIKSLGVDS